MAVNPIERLAEAIVDNRRLVILLVLLATIGIGAGVTMVESESSLDQFEADTVEADKLDYVDENFSGDDNTTTTQIIVEGDDVLGKDSLIEQLEYQQALWDNEAVEDRLGGAFEQERLAGVANGVARTAILEEQTEEIQNRSEELNATAQELQGALTTVREDPETNATVAFERVQENSSVELTDEHADTFEEAANDLQEAENESQVAAAYERGSYGALSDEYAALEDERERLEEGVDPTLDVQIDTLESLDESEVEDITEEVLSEDSQRPERLLFMPSHYEPGTATSNATMMTATLDGEGGTMAPGTAPESIVNAELAMQEIAADHDGDVSYRVFGDGITTDEIDASMIESLLVVAPFAFLFVLAVLAIAYRDPLDILLGLLGVVLVLAWTIGFMGWMDIAFNQLFIAVPVLLIGLSIDYAIHVFMRHREERENGDGDPGSAGAMRFALGGVGVALVFVTATAAFGFLANLASPLEPIREFGIVTSVGILSALIIFGALIPALKTELDTRLENRRFDRRQEAFGTNGGTLSSVLTVGTTAARTAPYVVIAIALVISAGGVYGATQVDTSFETEDFLADEPADWTDELPGPLEPTNYTANSSMAYLNDHFVRQDTRADILVEGDVTDAETLERLHDAEALAADKNVTATDASGEAAITSPLSKMNRTAAQNETFNETYTAADTTGDGIPDSDLEMVYDEFYDANDDAESVVYRDDGEYEALLLVVSVEGDADGETVTEQMRDVAAEIDGGGLTATATGQVILNSLTEDELFETVISSLAVSLFAVLVFLMATYRKTQGSASLGAVTMLPVVFTVTWILGTMYLLEIPFNIVTGMITSLTIGLGVAYSIHLTERYNQELARQDSVWDAMETSITGTGGALLGSAATTAAGFGVLIVAFLPFLQQFGLITALMIVFAFLASVLVLPSLLAVWTRLAGPEWTLDDFIAPAASASAGGGGRPSGGSPLGRIAVNESVQHLGRPGESDLSSAGTAADAGTGDSGGWDAEPSDDWNGPEGRDGSVSWDDLEGSFVPAEPTSEQTVGGRTIDSRYVEPGATVSATVSVPAVTDRFLVYENVDGADVSIEDVSPPTAEVATRDGTIYAAVDADGAEGISIRYELSVPDELPDGDTLRIDGTVTTAAGERPIAGGDEVVAVDDLFRRILARGGVSDTDLEIATEQLENGDLEEPAFESIFRAWLQGSATAAISQARVADGEDD